MDEVLICEEGSFEVVAGAISCTGTQIVSMPVADFLTSQGFMTAETLGAFWPWALLMFAIAYGVRMMRKTIYSGS